MLRPLHPERWWRSFARLLPLLLLAAPMAASTAEPARVTVPIVSGRVGVVAEFADTTGEPLFEARLKIRHGGDCYELPTYLVMPETLDPAVEELRRTIGWKGPYLFVRSSCGGGNNWRCTNETVFAIRNRRLVPLATLIARGDSAGGSYENGVFRDVHSDWEINDVTSHAGAPHFEIVLRDVNGRLTGDRARTWAANARVFQYNDSVWKSVRDSVASWNVTMTRTSALFTNAMIAKYCGRAPELKAALAEIRRTLDPPARDFIVRAVGSTVTGGLPGRARPLATRCGAGTKRR